MSDTTTREVHPGHGVHTPTSSSPVRAAGSVRRTSSFDMLRPDGLEGKLVLVGRARDLATGADGTARVLDTAALDVVIDFPANRAVRSIVATPHAPRLDALVGVSAATGFRAAAMTAFPDDHARLTLLNHLLDDVPVAALVSGQAMGANGSYPIGNDVTRKLVLQQADYCAGWIDDGVMISEIKSKGAVPVVTGPVAGTIERPDDPEGWHTLERLPIHGMRRRRRIDVAAGSDDLILVDAFFRDSHRGPDGVEVSIHEYTVTATVNRLDSTVRTIETRARVLPWRECVSAALGAQRLVDRPLLGLRDQLGTEFVGTMSCTHLNDTLRALEDVVVLCDFVDG